MSNSLLNTQDYARKLVICKSVAGKILFTVGNKHTKEKRLEVEKVFWGEERFQQEEDTEKSCR